MAPPIGAEGPEALAWVGGLCVFFPFSRLLFAKREPRRKPRSRPFRYAFPRFVAAFPAVGFTQGVPQKADPLQRWVVPYRLCGFMGSAGDSWAI